ncbi:acyltransferase [Bacillus sp. J37]|uniref:acyltransferase n=1 Tax=Bacillus sp. J37 TaxID=935837 RepID=UPI0004AEEEE3|nr:acyltransferase [Bacillus sp. J37]
MELQESIKNLTTNITGQKNILNLPETAKLHKVNLHIEGQGNNITIGENTVLRNLLIEIKGNNNHIKIGANCKIQGHILMVGDNQSVKIGSKTTFQHNVYLLASENKNITIGRDCMFSNNIDVRTTDAHSVIDAETGIRQNLAKDVEIGHHVWISANVLVSKGSVIPDNCIVGARSVVTKKFDETNCTLAGMPAKVVKTGVSWDRKRL